MKRATERKTKRTISFEKFVKPEEEQETTELRLTKSAEVLKVVKKKPKEEHEQDIICPIPLPKPAIITVWSILDESHANKIKKCGRSTRLKIISHICKTLFESKTERHLMKNLFYEVLRFALKRNYEPIKIATLFGMYFTTHKFYTSSLWHDYEETYEYFKEALFAHSIDDPPESVLIFHMPNIKEILERFTTLYLPVLPLIRVVLLPNLRLVMTWRGWKHDKKLEEEEQTMEPFELPDLKDEGWGDYEAESVVEGVDDKSLIYYGSTTDNIFEEHGLPSEVETEEGGYIVGNENKLEEEENNQ